MSEEIQVEMKEAEVDYKALYEKTQEDLQRVVAKKDELLTETKKVKQERAAKVKEKQ